MRVCPKCNETYKNENLNFCLTDGEHLMEMESNEAAPTMILDNTRVTNDGSWGSGVDPNAAQQNDPFQTHQQQNPQNQQIYQQPFASPAGTTITQDKTLATVSIALGASSLVLMCCYLGIPLGAAALVTGFLGMNKANSDPQAYGGKELAIIGMVLGGLSFIFTLILFFLGILGAILDL